MIISLPKKVVLEYHLIFLFFLCSTVALSAFAENSQSLPQNSEVNRNTAIHNSDSNDLSQIIQRKTLRIVSPINSPGGLFLPRNDSPMDKQIATIKAYALSIGVTPKVISITSLKEMLPTLIRGEADIIAANLTITEERKKKLGFSIPVDNVQEVVLVSKKDDTTLRSKDLEGKSLLLNSSSSFWKRGLTFKKHHPDINLVEQDPNLSDEDVINLIANQQYDATIRDSNIAEMYLNYRDDIRIAYKIAGKQDIALGLRPDSIELKKSLDKFLKQRELETNHIKTSYRDLAEIKKRGVLRILLRNNASSYFLWRGQLMGFEYEMAKAFAKHLKVRLAVYVPKDSDDAIDWLDSGKVDIAAGFLQATQEWQTKGISSSVPYHQAFSHIVVKANEQSILSIADLHERTVVLHKDSIYWKELEALKKHGINIKLVEAPLNLEVEEIIQKVANGDYEITIADEQYLNIELAHNVAVKSAFTFGDQKDHSLAILSENTQLLKSLNDYIKSKKDGRLYTRLYDKYFSNSKNIQRHLSHHKKMFDGKKFLSEFDKLVQKYSNKYGFDWRFITAQMFQESRFDPKAKSHAGAIGLMQVMPATAKQVGISKISNPEKNIHAGTKYMSWLYNKFEPDLTELNRIWFTLASYNAGLGHVLDARLLAKQQGLNKDIWFENVEKAMLLLSKKAYAKKARFGYVRGREPVGYVKAIKKYYATFLNIVPVKNSKVILKGNSVNEKYTATNLSLTTPNHP